MTELEAWQDWNRQMHHELHIGSPNVLPDDTKGRRELADRLRAGVVAADAVAMLRAERNQLAAKAAGVEPSPADSFPLPYRMTPELAAALGGLCVAEDPDPEHQAECHVSTLPETYLMLSKAVGRVTEILAEQTSERVWG